MQANDNYVLDLFDKVYIQNLSKREGSQITHASLLLDSLHTKQSSFCIGNTLWRNDELFEP